MGDKTFQLLLENILRRTGHMTPLCRKCDGYCRLYRTVLKTSGNIRECLLTMSVNEIYNQSITTMEDMSVSNILKIFDAIVALR